MDSSAKEKMQHGGDPMDVGAVGGWSWGGDTGGVYDHGDGVYAFRAVDRVTTGRRRGLIGATRGLIGANRGLIGAH